MPFSGVALCLHKATSSRQELLHGIKRNNRNTTQSESVCLPVASFPLPHVLSSFCSACLACVHFVVRCFCFGVRRFSILAFALLRCTPWAEWVGGRVGLWAVGVRCKRVLCPRAFVLSEKKCHCTNAFSDGHAVFVRYKRAFVICGAVISGFDCINCND